MNIQEENMDLNIAFVAAIEIYKIIKYKAKYNNNSDNQ